jgi:hypothetical protein
MQYIASVYADRFRHPILAAILTVAVVLLVSGGVVELIAPATVPLLGWGIPPIAAGFLAVFGILASAIGLVGYGVLFAARLVSILRDQSSPATA